MIANRVRRAGALVGTLLAVAALAGCGENVVLPDLFVVQRSQSAPAEKLTVVVNEGGAVHCNQEPTNPAHPARLASSADLASSAPHAHLASSATPAQPGPTHQLSDPQLVLARGIAEELQEPSAKHLALPPRPGSVFDYYVRDPEGTVRFADNSSGQPSVLRHLAFFVLEVAQKVCRLPA